MPTHIISVREYDGVDNFASTVQSFVDEALDKDPKFDMEDLVIVLNIENFMELRANQFYGCPCTTFNPVENKPDGEQFENITLGFRMFGFLIHYSPDIDHNTMLITDIGFLNTLNRLTAKVIQKRVDMEKFEIVKKLSDVVF